MFSFVNHDPLVTGVLYFLLLMSVFSWIVIVYKVSELWRANQANSLYAKQFWGSENAVAFLLASADRKESAPLAHLAANGIHALHHFHTHPYAPGVGGNLSDALTRALRQAIQDQTTRFESGLGFLATIGNTAPFVGLFGTVIGMMTTLQQISATGSTDLSVVAGPIGEALIATAAGIACAVPAVVAYNSLLRRLKVFGNTLDSFAYDLLSHLASEEAVRRVGAHAQKESK